MLVESGAGDGAWLTDAAYADAGASIVSAAELYQTADVILTVTRPQPGAVSELRPGQAVIGMLAPLAILAWFWRSNPQPCGTTPDPKPL